MMSGKYSLGPRWTSRDMGWPKSSFGFFHGGKTPNELFGHCIAIQSSLENPPPIFPNAIHPKWAWNKKFWTEQALPYSFSPFSTMSLVKSLYHSNPIPVSIWSLILFVIFLITDVNHGLCLADRESENESVITQSCPTLWDLMDCSPPGFSVLEILQARILEWVAIPFSKGSSLPRDRTWVSCIADRFFTVWATGWMLVDASRSYLPSIPVSDCYCLVDFSLHQNSLRAPSLISSSVLGSSLLLSNFFFPCGHNYQDP